MCQILKKIPTCSRGKQSLTPKPLHMFQGHGNPGFRLCVIKFFLVMFHTVEAHSPFCVCSCFVWHMMQCLKSHTTHRRQMQRGLCVGSILTKPEACLCIHVSLCETERRWKMIWCGWSSFNLSHLLYTYLNSSFHYLYPVFIHFISSLSSSALNLNSVLLRGLFFLEDSS